MGIAYNTSIVKSGLVLHLDAANVKSYPGSGTVWYDLSNDRRSIALQNGPTYSNGALAFDGLNDHANILTSHDSFAWTPNGAVGMSSMTIEMWVQSSDTVGKLYSKPWNWSGQYNIWIDPSFFYILSGTSSNQLNFSRSVSNGQWTQITVWADSVNMGYYINGDQHSGSKSHGLTGDIPSVGNAKTPLSLMALYPYGSGWAGLATHATAGNLSVCRVYNRALSATEIKQNFEALRGRYGV